MSRPVSRVQQIMAMVKALAPDDQQLLIEMIRQKVSEHRRTEMTTIGEARQLYQEQMRPNAAALLYRAEITVSSDGTLVLAGLPFQAGDQVEIIVRGRLREPTSGQRYPLRGKPIRYADPFESVAENDWEALNEPFSSIRMSRP